MTAPIYLRVESTAREPVRRRFALEVLGVGIFVSAYVHAAAAPIVYYVAAHESVRLFAPPRDRASVELTLAFASKASEPSPEVVIRPQPPTESPLREESDSEENAARSSDRLTAAPTNVSRTLSAPDAALPKQFEAPRAAPQGEIASAEQLAPRPLARRKDSTAPRPAERVADASSTARSETVDSPSQIASEIRLGAEAETLPQLVRNPPPVYPPQALEQGIEGRTIVRARVSRTGTVLATDIAQSSGSRLLDAAAEEAVQRWIFHPAQRFGLTVEREVGVPVVFSIREALKEERDAAESSGRAAPPASAAR
ncbi:MAG TPA: TonB family protein [Pirellulaceae bacterium]|jgi:protein TonB|nr:TonB family protein [Pirellulaceae bacterium]